jgi:outer membrane protein TolC
MIKSFQILISSLVLTLLCSSGLMLKAQSQDSLILSYADFLTKVSNTHPTSKMAELSLDKGRAYLLKARGGFDPKISTDVDQKYFDDKDYYSLIDGGFKIPTWYGIEIKGNYERNRGEFLNEQSFVPDDGLVALGIDLPLLRGLIIDERRAQLKQARIYQQATEFERLAMLNNLFFDASLAYYEWQEAYLRLGIADRGLELAVAFQEMVRGIYQQGAVPAIDTLEADILLQNRRIDRLKAEQDYVIARVYLSAFLWQDANTPLEVTDRVFPEVDIDQRLMDQVNTLMIQGDSLVAAHPELLFAQLDLDQQDIGIKLKKEDLKPDLRLNYNPLADFSDDLLSNPVDFNDYKWGLRFTMPMLFRKARADLQLAKIEREKSQLKLNQKTLKFRLELDAQRQKLDLLNDQFIALDINARDYALLVRAEERKFEIGESSVFLVNLRQSKFLEILNKRLETRYKMVYTRVKLISVFGQLPEVIN